MNAVYAVIANHKRVTKKGILHTTGLPEPIVDAMLDDLLAKNYIKLNKTYQDNGDTINIPVYVPVEKYSQPNLLFNDNL